MRKAAPNTTRIANTSTRTHMNANAVFMNTFPKKNANANDNADFTCIATYYAKLSEQMLNVILKGMVPCADLVLLYQPYLEPTRVHTCMSVCTSARVLGLCVCVVLRCACGHLSAHAG